MIKVDYTGALLDGTVFDTSLKAGRTPLEFGLGLGQVIPGWDRGLLGMCIGEKRKLTIPSHLAYGSAGAGNAIPPDATLVFTTELIAIQGYEPEEAAEEEGKEAAPKAEKEPEDLPEPETKPATGGDADAEETPETAAPAGEADPEVDEVIEPEATGKDRDEL